MELWIWLQKACIYTLRRVDLLKDLTTSYTILLVCAYLIAQPNKYLFWIPKIQSHSFLVSNNQISHERQSETLMDSLWSAFRGWTWSDPLPLPMSFQWQFNGAHHTHVRQGGTCRKPRCHGRSALTSSVGYTHPTMTVSSLWCGCPGLFILWKTTKSSIGW